MFAEIASRRWQLQTLPCLPPQSCVKVGAKCGGVFI
jgi:hypothetical protein